MKSSLQAKHVLVSLTGGLGNQLFQLAGASSLSPSKLTLITRFGVPRTTEGVPDVFYYKLPPHIELENATQDPIAFRKTVGYLLRMGVAPRSFEQNRHFRLFATFTAQILLSLRLRQFLEVYVANGVGFSSLQTNKNKVLLIGYFQTRKYLESNHVNSLFQSLELKSKPEILINHESLASVEAPLVVHVRLGDYRLETSFGILTEEYYQCIGTLWNSGNYKKIWLFSDEPLEAIDVIPKNLRQYVRVINDSNENPATTLELMRLGNGYVIANSSLSWWGAKLSKTSNPAVIAPTPWFKSMQEPEELIPREWQRRKGFK